jgi:hypothetical protein
VDLLGGAVVKLRAADARDPVGRLAHVRLHAAAHRNAAHADARLLADAASTPGLAGRARWIAGALARALVALGVFAVSVKTLAVSRARCAIRQLARWVDCWIDRRIRNGRVRAVIHGRITTPVSGVRIIKVGPFTAAQAHTNCQQPDDSHPHRMNDASGSRQGDAKPLESLTERSIY